jgi:hypothetical protein
LRSQSATSLPEANPAEVAAWMDTEGIDHPDELVFGGEVARRLKLSRERIRQLVEGVGKFPRPLASSGRDRVWRWG